MVNFSSQIHNLVLLLITIQVASNGAAKITSSMLLSNETSTRVARKAVPINGEQLVKSNEENLKRETDADPADGLSDSLSTAIEVRNTNARAYSYFYVGSWVWHIPLWFTLWFSFYVAFNVVRAIYGHKIDPDDYARRKRDLPTTDELNRLTALAYESFDKFKNKQN